MTSTPGPSTCHHSLGDNRQPEDRTGQIVSPGLDTGEESERGLGFWDRYRNERSIPREPSTTPTGDKVLVKDIGPTPHDFRG